MSGRLVILPHKSWNVWNQDNREKVARDERLHKEAEDAKIEKERLLLQEHNLDLLRSAEPSKVATADDTVKIDAVEPFRLFEDLERKHFNTLGNEEYLKEQAQKIQLQKKRDGVADWGLGEGSFESNKAKAWYEVMPPLPENPYITAGNTTSSSGNSSILYINRSNITSAGVVRIKIEPDKDSTRNCGGGGSGSAVNADGRLDRETIRKRKADPMEKLLKPNADYSSTPSLATVPSSSSSSSATPKGVAVKTEPGLVSGSTAAAASKTSAQSVLRGLSQGYDADDIRMGHLVGSNECKRTAKEADFALDQDRHSVSGHSDSSPSHKHKKHGRDKEKDRKKEKHNEEKRKKYKRDKDQVQHTSGNGGSHGGENSVQGKVGESTDSDIWAELRKKRLEREAVEKKRAQVLLAQSDIYGGGSRYSGASAGYGQQYHPHLARKHYN